jgi:hypothetical protein
VGDSSTVAAVGDRDDDKAAAASAMVALEGASARSSSIARDNGGFLQLVCLTFASVTTIVGVCMLMEHDSMDAHGWMRWLFEGKPCPYKLCPLLGECIESEAIYLVPTVPSERHSKCYRDHVSVNPADNR